MKQDFFYKGIIERVVDGDTYDITVDLGFKIYHKVRLRLKGVDTPEVYGASASAEGRAASEYVKNILENKTVFIKTYKNAPSTYNRWEADVYFLSTLSESVDTWISLADHLVESGHAVRVS